MGAIARRFGSRISAFACLKRINAWEDDNGYAECLLTCGLLNVLPKFRSVTAI